MLSKYQNYYLLVSFFHWVICKTYFMVKIRKKMALKINWSVKTSLRGNKGAARCARVVTGPLK